MVIFVVILNGKIVNGKGYNTIEEAEKAKDHANWCAEMGGGHGGAYIQEVKIG